MRPNYYRDIWVLGAPSDGFPGAFPRGLINKIRRRWWGQRRLWVCSGSHRDSDGVTIDIAAGDREGFRGGKAGSTCDPSVIGDAQQLPFADDAFDFVMADPPYSEEWAKSLYGTTYPSPQKILQEMWRVCEPGGHVLLLHRLIPQGVGLPGPMSRFEAIVGVGIIAAWSNIRALCVWKKPHRLETWAHGPVEAS